MPSTCPRCREVVAEDIVCCADKAYTWKCCDCHKVSSGFAIPYGRCHMCGGTLRFLAGWEFDDPMTVRPIRDAVQFELDTFHFYRLAMTRTEEPVLRSILSELYQHEVDHLHTLQERYHTHLAEDVLDLRPEVDRLLAKDLFHGLDFTDVQGGAVGLYDRAIEIERRNRDHFRRLADDLPEGPEREICRELAAEEDEHRAILETEREQFLVD